MIEFENYEKEQKTINLAKANLIATAAIIPISLVYLVPFYGFWSERLSIKYLISISREMNLNSSVSLPVFILMGIFIGGIILHELIHGVTFAVFTKKGFKSIKFGVLWKMLTPYCHCKEPLKVKQYILGAIMPYIVLGIIPAIWAIFTGSIFLLSFGIAFTIAAFGDFMIINLIRKEDSESLVLDHPSEAGCYIFRKNEF